MQIPNDKFKFILSFSSKNSMFMLCMMFTAKGKKAKINSGFVFNP